MTGIGRFFSTIRSKIVFGNLLLLILMGGSLWYLRVNIVSAGEAIAAQRAVLEKSDSANAAAKTFGEFKYWLTDFAASQLNESEDQAKKQHGELARHLKSLEAVDPKSVAAIRRHADEIVKFMQEATNAYLDDNRVLGNSMLAKSRAGAETASTLIQGVVASQQVLARKAGDAVVGSTEQAARIAVILLFIAVGTGAFLAWLILRAISRPIAAISPVVDALAKGDLSVRTAARGNDEITVMSRKLNEAIAHMRASVQEVTGAAAPTPLPRPRRKSPPGTRTCRAERRSRRVLWRRRRARWKNSRAP